MESVEVAIKLSKEDYKRLKEYEKAPFNSLTSRVYEAIANGILLLKGHGRLIDAEQLMNYCQNQIDGHKYADCNVIARFPIVLNAEEKE